MVSEILNVQTPSDRRQIAVPVENDRRSGVDRRAVFRDKKENESGLVYALEVLPPVRRVASVPHKIGEGEIVPALGMASLALINLPEDWRDMTSAYDQLKALKNRIPYAYKYDYKTLQHPFSFFRGTLLHDFVDPNKSRNTELAKKLFQMDKTFADTKIGQNILNLLGVEESGFIETNIKNIGHTDEMPSYVVAKTYNGCKFGKLTARAMNRTTLIGTAILAAIELPRIIKAINKSDTISEKAKNGAKQTVESGINVASITAGLAYGGAIGARYMGPVGSLLGMGAGAILGSSLSKRTQELIS